MEEANGNGATAPGGNVEKEARMRRLAKEEWGESLSPTAHEALMVATRLKKWSDEAEAAVQVSTELWSAAQPSP